MGARKWGIILLVSVAIFGLWSLRRSNPFRPVHGGAKSGALVSPDEDRLKRIAFLRGVITDSALEKEDRDTVVAAILELGKLKAAEAGKELAEKIDFHMSADGIVWVQSIPATEDVYPAVKALIKIGEPALPFVLDAVAEKDRSDGYLDNCRYILFRVIEKERGFERQVTVWNHTRAEVYHSFDAHIKSSERLRKLADRIKPDGP